MKKRLACAVALACAAILFAFSACSASQPDQSTKISVWTYYNGDQLSAFHKLVGEFNSSIGKEKGIVVESYNLGSVNDLEDAVMDSVNGKVGAEPVPSIFMAYADTAYTIDQMGMLVDLGPYLSEEERAQYVEGYLDEGIIGSPDQIKIFPIAKSVEVMVLNKTDFEPFAQETGVSTSNLQTLEGLVEVAQKYYEWTDAQTPEPGDGKAFCGFDSLANLFFIGAKQQGINIVTVQDGQVQLNFDKAAVRKIWDNYYIPHMKGYFGASGRYRSDDVKTGYLISLVGSSSGATFFPNEVVDKEGTPHSIETEVLPCPQFSGGQAYAVRQGAGLVVLNKSEEATNASLEFLRWFTQPEQNLQFSVSSGYLPVMKSASNMDAIREAEPELDPRMEQILTVAIDTVDNNTLYTPQGFETGTEFRALLESSLASLAAADAAVVAESVAAGQSLEEASAPFCTNEYFDQWYNSTLAQLEALVN